MKAIWLANLPTPPSVNFCYIPIACKKYSPRSGKIYWGAKLRPSESLMEYKRLIANYKKQHKTQLKALHNVLMQFVDKGYVLRVDGFVAFHEDRVFSVPNKKILQLDANNRAKPLFDGIVSLLGIDDSIFFRGDCEKVTTAQKELECTMVRIQPVRHRTLQQIQQMMKQDLASNAPKS